MSNPYRPQRNYGCRIHDQYTYFGMKTVVLENELVRISILLDKGGDIYEYLYKPLDLDYMWLTERGVQNPSAYKSTSDDPIANFIDYYEGGWQVAFPNGGPTSTYRGAQYGQHGEVAQMPWHMDIAEDTPERIAVRLSVATKKSPYRVVKTLSLEAGSTQLIIEETIHNEGRTGLHYMWGQHIALGKPFLEPGCRIRLPEGVRMVAEEVREKAAPGRVIRGRTYEWPLAAAPDGTEEDMSILPPPGTPSGIVYLTDFGETGWYEVGNERLGAGLRVEWDATEMPWLWFWQEFGATEGYPWYGRHYNIGLEPFCGMPTFGLAESVRNGTAGFIEADETRHLRISAQPFRLG